MPDCAHLTIVVANGTHDGGDEKELRTLVTDAVFDRVRVVNHDCNAPDLVYHRHDAARHARVCVNARGGAAPTR